MDKLNLGTRVELFAICTSLEYDLKKYIVESNSKIYFTEEMIEKAKSRKKNVETEEEILNQLDLKDFVDIVIASPYEYRINIEKAKTLEKYFSHIIPVRNRVMHTKPLELGDRALLAEVIQDINECIPWIFWDEVGKTKNIIESGSGELYSHKYIEIKEYNPKVYHNLPNPEFDDTGFIGRKRDIKEITELLLNKKNQVISVVGNGGMGKTATVVKTLYDLVDRVDNHFEAILWITLKTKTLSRGEFVEINDGIRCIPDIYIQGRNFIVNDDTVEPMECILEFMKEFNTLLVLDNMETINTGDINYFIRQIPENSKVLITSRLGLGEFEVRQKLEGMEKNDAITYFRELSQYYGLKVHQQDNEKIYKIINKDLYNNPLSIKWFLSGIYTGASEKQLLAHKDDLIDFCISNVFDKLKLISKKILQLFLLEKQKLTYGMIEYYIDGEDVSIRDAINELLTTYMIQASSGFYVMNDMSREYISNNYPPDNEFVKRIFTKRKQLKQIIQEVKVYGENAPFNPNTISSNLSNVDRQLATYYLHKALELGKQKQWDKCEENLEKAASIEPDFFEVYKVKAFLYAQKGELYGAIQNYDIALTKCQNDNEKAKVCYLVSVFYTIKMQEIDSAIKYINMADDYLPNTNEILLEKVRVYTYSGKYEEAEKAWHYAKEQDLHPNLRTLNIMANRFMELKRRQAELVHMRDFEDKYELLHTGICSLSEIGRIDDKTTITLLKLLTDLSYLYFYDKAMELMAEVVEKYSYEISRIDQNSKEKLISNLKKHKEEINSFYYGRIYNKLYNFKNESKEIEGENEGVVTKIINSYGFISNNRHSYKNGIFFSKNNAYPDIKVGDMVTFDIYTNSKGEAAKNIKRKID